MHLSDVVHTSYTNHKRVEWHIHTYTFIILIVPLHYCWGTWFKLMGPRTRVWAEHIWPVVGGHDLVYWVMQLVLSDVAHVSHTTHRAVGKYIYICVIFLGPLNDRWDTLFKLFLPKTRVIADHARGVFRCHAVVCGMIHSYQTWSIPHITLIEQLHSLSIHISLSLDHFTTGEVHGSISRVWELGQ